jgi:hypothetical protein
MPPWYIEKTIGIQSFKNDPCPCQKLDRDKRAARRTSELHEQILGSTWEGECEIRQLSDFAGSEAIEREPQLSEPLAKTYSAHLGLHSRIKV